MAGGVVGAVPRYYSTPPLARLVPLMAVPRQCLNGHWELHPAAVELTVQVFCGVWQVLDWDAEYWIGIAIAPLQALQLAHCFTMSTSLHLFVTQNFHLSIRDL